MLADRAANPEKHRAISQKSFARNRKTGTENRLSWKRRNRDKVRGYELKRRYGLTSEDQRRLRDAQDGKCGVCRKPLKERAHTDHDHKTGAVRGMLCGGCNIALGFFEKPGFYEAAMAYLAGHAGVQTGREGSNLTFSTSNAPS